MSSDTSRMKRTVPSNRFCELFRPLSRFNGGVLGSHITRVEQATAELLGVGRDITRVLRLSHDAPGISNNLLVYRISQYKRIRARGNERTHLRVWQTQQLGGTWNTQ